MGEYPHLYMGLDALYMNHTPMWPHLVYIEPRKKSLGEVPFWLQATTRNTSAVAGATQALIFGGFPAGS